MPLSVHRVNYIIKPQLYPILVADGLKITSRGSGLGRGWGDPVRSFEEMALKAKSLSNPECFSTKVEEKENNFIIQ